MLPFLPFPSSLLVRPPPPPPPPPRAFTPGQAEKRLKKWSMFGSSEEKYEDAADLFEKAANCYKREKMHKEAGNAFLKCAECFKKARFLFGESGVWACTDTMLSPVAQAPPSVLLPPTTLSSIIASCSLQTRLLHTTPLFLPCIP